MIWVSPFDTEFKIHFSVSLLFFEGGLLGRNGKKSSFHLFPNSMKAKKHMSGCLELSRFQFANRQIRSCWAEPGKGFCGAEKRPRGHGHIVEKSA